jgi:hypothetical protein
MVLSFTFIRSESDLTFMITPFDGAVVCKGTTLKSNRSRTVDEIMVFDRVYAFICFRIPFVLYIIVSRATKANLPRLADIPFGYALTTS